MHQRLIMLLAIWFSVTAGSAQAVPARNNDIERNLIDDEEDNPGQRELSIVAQKGLLLFCFTAGAIFLAAYLFSHAADEDSLGSSSQ